MQSKELTRTAPLAALRDYIFSISKQTNLTEVMVSDIEITLPTYYNGLMCSKYC